MTGSHLFPTILSCFCNVPAMDTLCFPNVESFFFSLSLSLFALLSLEYFFLFHYRMGQQRIYLSEVLLMLLPFLGSFFRASFSEPHQDCAFTFLLTLVTFILKLPSFLAYQLFQGDIHVDYLCALCASACGTLLVLNMYFLVLKSDFQGIYIH